MVSWAALGGLFPASQGRWSFPSTQLCQVCIWSPVSSSELHCTGEIWTYWRESINGPQRWWGNKAPNIWGSAWRRKGSGGILSAYINTWREGTKKMEPGSFQWCPHGRTRGNRHNWNTGGSVWTSGNTVLLWGWLSTRAGCPERLRSLPA